MAEQCKFCFKKAATTYKNQPMCTRHWKNASEFDEKQNAKNVLHIGPLPVNLEDIEIESEPGGLGK